MLSTNQVVQVNVTTAALALPRYRFDVGLILGTSAVLEAAERIKGYDSLAAMVADGFTVSMPEHIAAAAYFAQDPPPKKVMIGLIDGEETPVQALGACRALSEEFYPVYVCSGTDDLNTALAAAIKTAGGNALIYNSSTAIATAIVASGIFFVLNAAENNRALGIWSEEAYAGAALMGLACGLANKYRDSAWALCYKQLQEIDPSASITEAQVTSLKGVNANVFLTRGPRNMFENGSMAGGQRYDETMVIDRITDDLRQACFELITGTPTKLPQNDSTTALLINACSSVCRRYYEYGILGPGIWRGAPVRNLDTGTAMPDGYVIMSDSYSSQSDVDRLAKKAVPMYVVVHLSGAVESVLIEMAVQL